MPTSSASTWSARRRRSRTTETEAHILRAPRARPLRRDEVHDGPVRRSRAIPSCCSTARRGPSSPRPSATGSTRRSPAPGEGRLPRYAWRDHYALLRERLDALGRSLGGRYRVLVDENQHVDREGARRAGRRLLRQEHDADHARARLLGRARHARHRRRDRADAAARARLRPLPPLHRRVPDRRAGRARHARLRRVASRTGHRLRRRFPEDYREELGASVYGCDICQDVCPWNRGVEKRRGGRGAAAGRPSRTCRSWTG